jgi:hypothetical protein
MQIRWDRIVGIVLIGSFLYLFCKLQPFLRNLVDSANQDYGQDPLIIRILMLGLVCLTFVGGIKLMLRK